MSEAIGWVAMGLALLVGVLNFSRSFLRFPLYRLLGWEYRSASGLPMIGSISLIVALACLWHLKSAWIAAAVIALIDTGGLPWFVAIMTAARLGLIGAKPTDANAD